MYIIMFKNILNIISNQYNYYKHNIIEGYFSTCDTCWGGFHTLFSLTDFSEHFSLLVACSDPHRWSRIILPMYPPLVFLFILLQSFQFHSKRRQPPLLVYCPLSIRCSLSKYPWLLLPPLDFRGNTLKCLSLRKTSPDHCI